MKLFILLSIVLFSINSHSKNSRITAKLEGMTCPMCAAAIEKEVKKLEGFHKIAIDISEETITVTGQNLTKTSVRKAINKTHFRVTKIKEGF